MSNRPDWTEWILQKNADAKAELEKSKFNAGTHPMTGREKPATALGGTYEFDHNSSYDDNFKAAKEHYGSIGVKLTDERIHNVLKQGQKKKAA